MPKRCEAGSMAAWAERLPEGLSAADALPLRFQAMTLARVGAMGLSHRRVTAVRSVSQGSIRSEGSSPPGA